MGVNTGSNRPNGTGRSGVMEQPGDILDSPQHYGTIKPTKQKIKYPDRDACARIVGSLMDAKTAQAKALQYSVNELHKHRDTRGVLATVWQLSRLGFNTAILYAPKRGSKRLLKDLQKKGFAVYISACYSHTNKMIVDIKW